MWILVLSFPSSFMAKGSALNHVKRLEKVYSEARVTTPPVDVKGEIPEDCAKFLVSILLRDVWKTRKLFESIDEKIQCLVLSFPCG